MIQIANAKYDPNSVGIAIFSEKTEKQDVFDTLELY